jgi:hypothetical protein
LDLPTSTRAIQAIVEFTYDPSAAAANKWIDVVSWKKSDREASFVFRISEVEKCFQLYFGDGKSIKGNTRIPLDGFRGRRCRLTYTRISDFTFVRLNSGDTAATRFVVHRAAVTARVPVALYEEGQPEAGITVHDAEFSNVAEDDLDLAAVERDLTESGGRSASSWSALARAYFWRREYSQSLAVARKAYHLDSSRINFVVFAKARSCISTLHPPEERPGAWRKFSSPHDVIFGRAKEAALSQKYEDSTRIFTKGVHRVFGAEPYGYSELHQDRICAAFSGLVEGIRGKVPAQVPDVKTTKRIIVSGMGWSGSGAVYDYLREFDGIEAIPGESPYIEGPSSLQAIHAALDDDRKFKQRVLDFFFGALIGYGFFRNNNDFKLFKSAREILSSKQYEEILASIEGWCALASAMFAADSQARRDRFSALADYTIERFSIGRKVPAGKIALLDNVVHIENADACIPFLGNTTLLCVFRDPRSNYVALVRERPSFNLDIHTYVRQRKQRLVGCTRAVASAESLAKEHPDRTVEAIRFEEFVLSENFREALAVRLGLNPQSRKQFSQFKPWESMRNVVLHQEHPSQDEIKVIAAELGAHCIEPGIRPLIEDNQG